MATFVIETYLSRARAGDLERTAARLRRAASEATSSDPLVRHIRSFYVRADEMAYHLVEAASIEIVDELGRAAGLRPERIVEAESG